MGVYRIILLRCVPFPLGWDKTKTSGKNQKLTLSPNHGWSASGERVFLFG